MEADYNFTDRGSQIDASVLFGLNNNTVWYDALRHRPERIKQAAIELFYQNYVGYHAQVIRAAMRELQNEGMLNGTAAPYTHEELYSS